MMASLSTCTGPGSLPPSEASLATSILPAGLAQVCEETLRQAQVLTGRQHLPKGDTAEPAERELSL